MVFASVLLLAAAGPARAQTVVRTVALRPAAWRATIELGAEVDAEHSATLAAARGGLVVAVLFRSGQSVAAGAVLVRLDDGPEAAQLALDQARLNEAARAAGREAKLMTIAGASQAALEQAEANQAEAGAQVALDQADLRQLRIVAPFAGTLGIRRIDAGDYVQAGQVVASLAQPAPLRVLFSVPQTEAGGLAPGQPFSLGVPALGGGGIAGRIAALAPMVDPATNARDVEGAVTGAAPGLLPGMFGTVTLATGAAQPAFSVPSTALNDDALGRYVFRLDPATDGNAVLRAVYVTPLGTAGDEALIAGDGLAAGDRVVAIGGFKLADGASVRAR